MKVRKKDYRLVATGDRLQATGYSQMQAAFSLWLSPVACRR